MTSGSPRSVILSALMPKLLLPEGLYRAKRHCARRRDMLQGNRVSMREWPTPTAC